MKKAMHLIAALGLAIGVSGSAQAQLVTNGGFEVTTSGNGQMGYNTDAVGWTVPNGSYNFIFASGTADTSGANGQFGNVSLWGPNNGSFNVLPATSPDGGNFIAADADFGVGAISQTINNLIIGRRYDVSFYWAAAQQKGFDGPTTERWTVSLGGESHATPVLNTPSHGFIPWDKQTFSYTATAVSEKLSFLAGGTPGGEPPFVLLDGVSIKDVTPEGSSLGLLSMGLLSLGGIRVIARRGSRASKSAK